MDFPNRVIPPISISTVQRYAAGQIANMLTTANNQTNITPVTNQAVFIPVTIPWYYPVARVFWANGSVVAGSNVDFGIYNWDGSQLYHTGSTAQAGTSVAQFVVPASPFILPPGQYYFALACDGASTNLYGVAAIGANEGRCCGLLQQASAMPLPASATFAQWASTGLPFFGVTRKASL